MFGLFKRHDTVPLARHSSVVSGLLAEIEGLRSDVRQAERAADAEKARAMKSGRLCTELLTERDAARGILREINGMVTPACAGIGRKMAAKAREGLPEFAAKEAA